MWKQAAVSIIDNRAGSTSWFLVTTFLLALMLLTTSELYAQSTGSVSGIIKDASGPLPGAAVAVQGTMNGAATGPNGEFRIRNVKEGEHVLVVSFIGYEPKEVTVQVEAGENVDLEAISMSESAIEMGELMVTGSYMPSQMRALSIQRESKAIMNVLASDAIGKLPDRNAAEAVQRIQGVSLERDHGEGRYVIVRGAPIKWNSNLINGDRLPASEGTSNDAGGDRAVPLDIFPTEMIQYVQLSKALTPDMEGDAIGGSVNFITKTAPAKQTLNVSMAGGYNGQSEAESYNASVLYGDRILDDKLGFIVTGTIWERNWGTDNYEVAYNASSGQASNEFAISELELRDYLGTRTTLGLNFGSDYRLNDNNKIFARGIYSQFSDNERAREQLYNFLDAEATLRIRNGITQIALKGGEFGGEHYIGQQWKMDWKGSWYVNELTNDIEPDFLDASERGYMMTYFTQYGVQFGGLSGDGYKYLSADAPAGVTGDDYENIQPRIQGAYDPAAYMMNQMLSYGQYSREEDYVGQFNVEGDLSETFSIKTGAKMRFKNREGGAPMRIYIPYGLVGVPDMPIRTLSEFDTESFPAHGGYLTELGNNYQNVIHDQVSIDQLHQFFTPEFIQSNAMYSIIRDENNADAAASYYNGDENVYAGYVMAEYEISPQWSLVAGVRHEITAQEYHGNEIAEDTEGNEAISPVTNSKTTHAFLPMAHLKYSPTEYSNIRLAVTRTFARPDFGDLNPGTTRNEISRVISSGNPELDPTFSLNIDLMGEYFFSNIGVISGGVFYKAISNDVFISTKYEDIGGVNYLVTKPQNLENGYLAGFEMGISRRLDFLPGALSGLGIDANYTFTDSEVNVPSYTTEGDGTITKTTTKQPFPSQADHIFNASVFYEKGKLMMRVAANYKGAFIVSFSEYGSEHNRWYDKNLTMDFSSTYMISNKMSLFAEVNNLTNAPLRYYHGNTNRPEQVEYYSIRGQLGVRVGLFN